jgi:transposase
VFGVSGKTFPLYWEKISGGDPPEFFAQLFDKSNPGSGICPMISFLQSNKVFLALGSFDLRKSIDGLSIMVSDRLSQDPFSGHVFVFCNRKRTIIKLLCWDRNGFWLCQKRLEKQRFCWPSAEKEVMELGIRELSWLLDGLDLGKTKGHSEEKYSTIM